MRNLYASLGAPIAARAAREGLTSTVSKTVSSSETPSPGSPSADGSVDDDRVAEGERSESQADSIPAGRIWMPPAGPATLRAWC